MDGEKIFKFIVCVIIIGIISWIGFKREQSTYDEAYNKGYVDACKDFYKEKLKYEIVENEDGTREWKKIEKNNKVKNAKIIYQHGNFKHGVMVK